MNVLRPDQQPDQAQRGEQADTGDDIHGKTTYHHDTLRKSVLVERVWPIGHTTRCRGEKLGLGFAESPTVAATHDAEQSEIQLLSRLASDLNLEVATIDAIGIREDGLCQGIGCDIVMSCTFDPL